MRCMILAVLLLMSSAGFAFSDGHSHYFFSTLIYNSSPGFPSFFSTQTIDDVTLIWFHSDDGVVERRVPWFKPINSSLLQASINEHQAYENMVNISYEIMIYLNDTEGYHILQNIDGCVLLPNGTVQLKWSYHYDGKPLTDFDWETQSWRAELPEYEDLVEELFGHVHTTEDTVNVLLNDCIPHIRELLVLGNCTFDRRSPPIVKVTHIPMDKVGVKLYCRAYGHYPKKILTIWYKNGKQIPEKMMERVTLPLPDLTYLTSLSVNVTSLADDLYTCRVNHSSMPRDYIQNWRISDDNESLSRAPSNPLIGAVIAICLAIILVIVVTAFGAVTFAQSRRQ